MSDNKIVQAVTTTASVAVIAVAAAVALEHLKQNCAGTVKYTGWYRSSDEAKVSGIFAAISHRYGFNATFLRVIALLWLFGAIATPPSLLMAICLLGWYWYLTRNLVDVPTADPGTGGCQKELF